MVHVLYNVATFGVFQLTGGHRAGIGRVVEETARALQTLPGCDLRMMASDFQGPAADYLSAHFPGGCDRLVHAGWQVRASRALITTLYRPRLMFDAELGRRHRTVRVARLAVKAALAPVRPLLRRVPAAALAATDVFHETGGESPPLQFQNRRKPSVFVTVYDLIRLRHPEFFAGREAMAAENRRTLGSLSPAYWYTCISESTRQDLLATGRCDSAKVSVTPLAAGRIFRPHPDAAEAATVRVNYGVPADTPFLLSLCTLEPRKNLIHVIRSFLRLLRESPARLPDGLRLVLVGTSGWHYGPVHELVASAEPAFRERIVFTGFMPDEDLPAFLTFTAGFLYLSLYEGFGLPPLEAMACGAPVVTSNTSALPEVVGDAGILLGPHDEDGLCQTLLNLLGNERQRQDLSRRALARAATFSWERCAQETLAAYRRALG